MKHVLILCATVWLAGCETPRVLISDTVVLNSRSDPAVQEWPISSPSMQGMDEARLDQLRQQLIGHAPAVRSLVIVRRGHLVFEHYSQGVASDDLQRINSVTKSFVGALVGIALDRGLVTSVEQPISAYVPTARSVKADRATREITIADLLTMTAGYEWDERARDACFGSRTGSCAQFAVNTDLVSYAVRRPQRQSPGTQFNYDSYSSHLLSAVLTRATGSSAAKFAEENLFVPLGVQKYRWDVDAEGNSLGGSGLYMRSRDLAKLGQLYLDNGNWRGKQLLSARYVEQSSVPRSGGGWPGQSGYGFHWWVRNTTDNDRMFFALGYGGQFIMVYPNLDMVVVITSNQTIRAEFGWITRTYIVPAANTNRGERAR